MTHFGPFAILTGSGSGRSPVKNRSKSSGLAGPAGLFRPGHHVEQRLLDGLVSTVGCRPGPAHRTLAGDPERSFDAAGCLVRLDARGVEIVSGANLGGAIAVADGLALVGPPGDVLPPERLAWLLAPPGAVFVPSGGPGAWLLEVMPRAEQAGRPGQPGGF